MKSIVLIKQVPEAPSIQGEPGGAGTVASDSQNVINPYDLFAIEEGSVEQQEIGYRVYRGNVVVGEHVYIRSGSVP